MWGNYLTFKIKRENDSSMQRTFSLVLGFEKNIVESVCDKKEGKKEKKGTNGGCKLKTESFVEQNEKERFTQ